MYSLARLHNPIAMGILKTPNKQALVCKLFMKSTGNLGTFFFKTKICASNKPRGLSLECVKEGDAERL